MGKAMPHLSTTTTPSLSCLLFPLRALRRAILFSVALVALLALVGCKNSAPESGEKSGGGLLSGITSKGGCYNAYYPATATLKKTYKTTFAGNNMPPSTHTETFSNVTADGFTQKMEFTPSEVKGQTDTGPMTVEHRFKCQPDGLAAVEFVNMALGHQMNLKFKTLNVNGLSFPKESEWKVGKKWQIAFQIESETAMGAMKDAMKMLSKGTITMDCEIVGQESVTVPAGTFDAFKVNINIGNKLSANIAGREMPMNTDIKTVSWFAKDVGVVKSSFEGLGGAGTELISLVK